jgi:hypothetical protein
MVDLVIARYAEDLAFLDELPLHSFQRVILYNKGDPLAEDVRFEQRLLPNVGRIDHAIAHHCATEPSLGAVTVFIPASCKLPRKWRRVCEVISEATEKRRSVFYVAQLTSYWDMFQMERYACANPANLQKNPHTELQLSPIRPFGRWYAHHFSTVGPKPSTYMGVFAVERDHILARPRAFYETLARELSTHHNPEVGHYIERSWLAVFSTVPRECMHATPRNTRFVHLAETRRMQFLGVG